MAGTIAIDTIQNGSGASVPTTTIINGSAKAWCYFDGTVASGAPTRTFNVSSYTRTATGTWTVNFTNALTSSDYCALATCNGAGGVYVARAGVTTRTATSCDVFNNSADTGIVATNKAISFAAFA